MKHERFHKNAIGDFYTTGDCLACEIPEHECPECLALLNDGNIDTYFLKQPETHEEIKKACSAALSCCVAAIRYGGKEPDIINQLGNRPEYCDNLLPGGPIRFSWEGDKSWEQAKLDYRESKLAWWKKLIYWKK